MLFIGFERLVLEVRFKIWILDLFIIIFVISFE